MSQITVISILSGLISASIAGLSDSIKIKGLNSGRNSYAAISKIINTKFHNGTISRISSKTFSKIFAYNMSGSFVGSAVSGLMDVFDVNDRIAKMVIRKVWILT